MPPVTGHDESWPFFHFWPHYFWPKLASSILHSTSAGGKDLSNDVQIRVIGLMEPEICSKGRVKNNSCHYTSLLHGKNCPSRWHFLRSFLTASKPSRRSITAAKKKENEKEEGKKNSKIEKPKIFISAQFVKRDASGKGKLLFCKCIFNWLTLIWSRSSLKPPKCPKNSFLEKSSRSQWVKVKSVGMKQYNTAVSNWNWVLFVHSKYKPIQVKITWYLLL